VNEIKRVLTVEDLLAYIEERRRPIERIPQCAEGEDGFHRG
jgi:hypothetical protein